MGSFLGSSLYGHLFLVLAGISLGRKTNSTIKLTQRTSQMRITEVRLRSPENLWQISRFLHKNGFRRSAKLIKFMNYCIHKTLLPAEAIVGSNIILEHYSLV